MSTTNVRHAMTVEIDVILRNEELQVLLEAAEQAGQLRHVDLLETLEPLELDALEQRYPLTWLYVEKDVDGRPAVQLERLVNELSAFLPTTYLVVPREGPRSRFVPVKTPEDLEHARPLLRELLAASLF